MLINKLLKPIKAFVAIVVTLPAIYCTYLPFRLQNVYKRLMSLLAYRLKNCKLITNLVIIQKQDDDGMMHDRDEE